VRASRPPAVRRIVLAGAALLAAWSPAAAPRSAGGPSVPPPPAVPSPAPFAGARSVPPPPVVPAPAAAGAGWLVTVYYTAVQGYHTGAPVRVTGCPRLACSHGTADLGRYPGDFVAAVRGEGSGRTADGRYLNWSYDTGFWLDTAPRDTAGEPLRPYVSAAADPGELPRGTAFTITGCGRQDDGSAPPSAVCARLRGGHWRVADEFTPGLGGHRHVDAYIGLETGPRFTGSDWYTTLVGATLRLG
jgi:hypothetical protein